jgi:hypothetical protein
VGLALTTDLSTRALNEPAVYEYFNSLGWLICVAADAFGGPQITVDGTELTGRNALDLYQWMLSLPDSVGEIRWGPRGNPGVEELGLVVRVQVSADGPLTRPVLVGRDWAEGCVDDAQSVIPECEFCGRVFPDPRFPDRVEVFPSPEDTPSWADRWSPPF